MLEIILSYMTTAVPLVATINIELVSPMVCNTVDDITIDLPVPIDRIAFFREVFIFCMDMEGVRLKFCGTEFST